MDYVANVAHLLPTLPTLAKPCATTGSTVKREELAVQPAKPAPVRAHLSLMAALIQSINEEHFLRERSPLKAGTKCVMRESTLRQIRQVEKAVQCRQTCPSRWAPLLR